MIKEHSKTSGHRLSSIFSYLDVAGKAGKFDTLDGLRAIAIMLVLARHGIDEIAKHHTLTESTLTNIANNGWLGVDLFFVLSGFLISYHLISTIPKYKFFNVAKLYFIQRAFRILPLYYAMLFLVIADLIPFYDYDYDSAMSKSTEFITHFLFLQDYLGARVLVTLWSLATEIKFYLIAPFMLLVLINTKMTSVRVPILMIAIICVMGMRLNNSFDLNDATYPHYFWDIRAPFHLAIDGLLLGMLIEFIRLRNSTWLKQNSTRIFLLGTLIMIFLLSNQVWLNTNNWPLTTAAGIVSSFAFFMIVLGGLDSNAAKKILGSTWLRFIARLSYSLYLVHYTVLPFSLNLANINLDRELSSTSICVFAVAYLTITFIFSILLHYLIEKPALHYKKRFTLNS